MRFNFYVYAPPFIDCLYFICERKFYPRAYVKITRQWKPTLVRTPYYYGQLTLSLRKESLYIFSKFNSLSTDTPLIRTDTFYGPLSVCINGV